MKQILSGEKPSLVFKQMLEKSPSLRNSDVASAFRSAFPNVDGRAIQAIWRWRRQGDEEGIDDERLDEIIQSFLGESGYFPKD
jgi:hypothetical protein